MVGYLQFAQLVRTANARIRSARELEQRWKALGPEGQAEARTELDRLMTALKAVRDRIAAGPRGFVREFKSAYRGEETGPIAEPASLGAMLGELHAASNALREKLDAVEGAAAEQAAAPAPAPAPTAESVPPTAPEPATTPEPATAPEPAAAPETTAAAAADPTPNDETATGPGAASV